MQQLVIAASSEALHLHIQALAEGQFVKGGLKLVPCEPSGPLQHSKMP